MHIYIIYYHYFFHSSVLHYARISQTSFHEGVCELMKIVEFNCKYIQTKSQKIKGYTVWNLVWNYQWNFPLFYDVFSFRLPSTAQAAPLSFFIALLTANQNVRTSVYANVILTNEIVILFISATQAHLSSANEKQGEAGVRVKAYLWV